MPKRETVVLPLWELCLEVRKPGFGFPCCLQTSCVTSIKSPNFSGMWAPCTEKEEIGLDDPLLILHPFISLLASDLSWEATEKRRKLLACPTTWSWVLGGYPCPIINRDLCRSRQGPVSSCPTVAGRSPRNHGLDFISWLRSIWGYKFGGWGIPISENLWNKFWVKYQFVE